MDKLIFLMRRKHGTTREHFHRHYLDFHSLLGLRLVRTLAGYTVNVTDVEAPPAGRWYPDAVVEMWTPDVATFMDPVAAYERSEDKTIVMYDDASFIGESWIWQVEETWVRGAPQDDELRTRTPGVKRISVHRVGDQPPPIGADVVRVVDHRTLTPLTRGLVRDRDGVADVPPYEGNLIRCEWASTIDALGPMGGDAVLVSEYRQRAVDR